MATHRTVNIRDNEDAQLWELAKTQAQVIGLNISWVIRQLLVLWLNGEIKIKGEVHLRRKSQNE